MVARAPAQLTYIANAIRFRVPSLRRATFRTPRSVRLGSRSVPLVYPDEGGVGNDFVTCFMVDDYGLGRVRGPVRTILDIGANIGFFSLAARAHFPGAAIDAYEPNPRVLPYLRRNASVCAVRVCAEAVADRAGTVSIIESGDSNQARTQEGGEVPLIALSTAVERLGGVVDLAKIDCEGAEWDMFRDERGWRGIRQLRMEYHLWGRHAYREVSDRVAALGFYITHHRPSGQWGTLWAER